MEEAKRTWSATKIGFNNIACCSSSFKSFFHIRDNYGDLGVFQSFVAGPTVTCVSLRITTSLTFPSKQRFQENMRFSCQLNLLNQKMFTTLKECHVRKGIERESLFEMTACPTLKSSGFVAQHSWAC